MCRSALLFVARGGFEMHLHVSFWSGLGRGTPPRGDGASASKRPDEALEQRALDLVLTATVRLRACLAAWPQSVRQRKTQLDWKTVERRSAYGATARRLQLSRTNLRSHGAGARQAPHRGLPFHSCDRHRHRHEHDMGSGYPAHK